MVTINKAVLLYSFHRGGVNPKHIQENLFQKKQNEIIHIILHPQNAPCTIATGIPDQGIYRAIIDCCIKMVIDMK